ncbi:MAG: signal protein PDZ [Ruaniaceae bacterium]|nr:signal protein PDZ [Ruaniaceae bacterium]
MNDRSMVVPMVSGVTMVALAAGLMLVPMPYAVQSPGPTINTMGAQGDTPIITVDGAQTFPVGEGELRLTTVSVRGGPSSPATPYDVLAGWWREDSVVIPREQVFGTETAEELSEYQQIQMANSQQNAVAAALQALDYEVPMVLNVVEMIPGMKASEVLVVDDVITGIARSDTGAHIEIDNFRNLTDFLGETPAGTSVTVDVQRGGNAVTETFETSPRPEGDRRAGSLLGVFVAADIQNPVDVQFDLDRIGGPSAGLMFALGVIDLMTPGDLTGGEIIAGTGTMSIDSYVGAIGGVRQKMHGAVRDGASWFLVPVDNCAEVLGFEPEGLTVIPVDELSDAREAVEAIASGQTDGLPTCAQKVSEGFVEARQ